LKIIAKFGTIKAEKIEPMLKYIRFPFPTEGSGEFHFGLLRDSISSTDFLDFAARPPSFSRQFSASDLGRDVPSDQFALHNIWQTRPYEDVNVMYFESAAVNHDYAAFIATSFNTNHRVISFLRYCEPTLQWHRVSIGAQLAMRYPAQFYFHSKTSSIG
jgi:hypothetical protein